MMGESIDDRHLRDNGEIKEIRGLGLLPAVTTFAPDKTTVRAEGRIVHPLASSPSAVLGYEIQFGETRRLRDDKNFYTLFLLNGKEDGLADPELRAAGTYLHNAFHNDAFRALWLNALRRRKGIPERPASDTSSAKDEAYDALAARMTEHLDVEYFIKLSGLAS
jgi:adenosylcobyric acid synthase